MMIPILLDHNPDHPIGRLEIGPGRSLVATFADDTKVTREMFFQMFNVGAQFHKVDGDYIREAQIFEVSLASR